MSKNNKGILLYAAIFGSYAFFMQLISLGTIISTGLDINTAWKTAYVIAFQAIGVMLGIAIFSFVSNKGVKVNILQENRVSLISGFLSLTIFFLEALSSLWLICLLLRSAFGVILISQMFSQSRYYLGHNSIKANKLLQVAETIAFVIAFFVIPAFVTVFGFKGLFLADSIGQLICSFGLIWIRKKFFLNLDVNNRKNTYMLHHSGENKRYFGRPIDIFLLAITFMVWLSVGVFHVLEVPILKYRLNMTIEWITLFFGICGVVNIAAMQMVKLSWLKKHSSIFFILSSIILIIISLIYLRVYSYIAVFAIGIGIGVANGIFNLSQTTLLQRIESERKRTYRFLWLKLVSQLGLLNSAILIILLNATYDNTDLLSTVISISIPVVIILAYFLIKREKCIESI